MARCDHATFFVTTEWLQTWMDSFGPELQPTILLFRTDPETVRGACLLVRRTERRGPFKIRRLYLNTAGEDDCHSPCVEFNTLLCEPGYELTMAVQLRKYIDDVRRSAPWDEFVAPGLVGSAFEAIRTAFDLLPVSDQVRHSHYVDLDAVRASGKPYATALGSRDRTRYRHNVRLYSETGELVLDEPSTVDEALQLLDELVALHQKTWTERGLPGSFSSEVFSRFHRQLIARCFPIGGAQLLRLRAGKRTIGCLYNFVFRGKVYFYQSGFDYSFGEKASPGITVHVAAIEHAARSGLGEYDLMAGDVDYKKRLANRHRELHWATWKARGAKMRAVELLRKTKHAVQEHSLTDIKESALAAFQGLRRTLRTQE